MYKIKVRHKKDISTVIFKVSGATRGNRDMASLAYSTNDYRILLPKLMSNKKMTYEVQGFVTLTQYLTTYMTEETFFGMVLDFVQVVATLERAGLPVGNLVLNSDYIFVSTKGQGMRYLFLPVDGLNNQVNIFSFLQFFLNRRISPTGSNTPRMNSYRQFLYSQPYFSTEAFLEYLAPKNYTEDISRRDFSVEEKKRQVNDYRPPEKNRYADPGETDIFGDDNSDTIPVSELVEDEIGTSVLGETCCLGVGNTTKITLTRVRTNETIQVNKSVFRVGSGSQNVEYRVSDNRAVSRIHAVFTTYNGKCFVKDNNSTNSTYVNGEKLVPAKEHQLENDDRITIADEVFVYNIQ